MSYLFNINKFVFKKDVYCTSANRYVTYYLFTADSINSDQKVEDIYTSHAQILQHNPPVEYFIDNPIKGNTLHQCNDVKVTDATNNSSVAPTTSPTDVPLQSKWYLPEALKYFLSTSFSMYKRDKKADVSMKKK